MRQFCQAFVQVLGSVIAQQQMTHTDQTLFKCHDFLCGRHAILEVTVRNCAIRIPELLLVNSFPLFALSNYGINCQKKWYQPAVSVLLYRV